MIAGMSNQGEMPFTVANKYVAYKHLEGGLFAPYMYAAANTIVHVCLALPETLVSTAISYHMTGLARQGDRWIYFAFIVFLVNVAIGSLLRTFGYVSRTLEEAQTLPAGLIAIQVLFSGFMLSPKLMGWLLFLVREVTWGEGLMMFFS